MDPPRWIDKEVLLRIVNLLPADMTSQSGKDRVRLVDSGRGRYLSGAYSGRVDPDDSGDRVALDMIRCAWSRPAPDSLRGAQNLGGRPRLKKADRWVCSPNPAHIGTLSP